MTALLATARTQIIRELLFPSSWIPSVLEPIVQLAVFIGIVIFRFPLGAVTSDVAVAGFVVTGFVGYRLFSGALTRPYQVLYVTYWNNRIEGAILTCGLRTFLIGAVSGSLAVLIARTAVVLFAALIIFPLPVNHMSLGPAIVFLVLGGVASLALGTMGASMFYLIDARGGKEPVTFFVELLGSLISGSIVPTTLLPKYFEVAGWALPQTWAVIGLRASIGSAPFPYLAAGVLALQALLYGGLGFVMLRGSLRRASCEGRIGRWV
ncbi:MAG: ABC transporter permease [Bacillota bacterium]